MCLPDSIEDWEETEANFGRMGSGVAGGGCLWWPIGEMPKQSEVEAKWGRSAEAERIESMSGTVVRGRDSMDTSSSVPPSSGATGSFWTFGENWNCEFGSKKSPDRSLGGKWALESTWNWITWTELILWTRFWGLLWSLKNEGCFWGPGRRRFDGAGLNSTKRERRRPAPALVSTSFSTVLLAHVSFVGLRTGQLYNYSASNLVSSQFWSLSIR